MKINTLEFRLNWDGGYDSDSAPQVEVLWAERPVYDFAITPEEAQWLAGSQDNLDAWGAQKVGKLFEGVFG